MWPAEGRPDTMLCVVVGARRVRCGVVSQGRWRPEDFSEQAVDLAAGIDSPAQAACAAIRELAASWQHARQASASDNSAPRELRVLVADTWLAMARVPWSAALAHAQTAPAHARAQLLAAGFDIDADAAIRLDDAPFGRPRLVVAYPAPLLSAFAELAASAGARLACVLPLSVAAWIVSARLHRSMTALAIASDGLLSWVQGEGGRASQVTVRPDGGESQDLPRILSLLRTQWQRMQLREAHLERVAALQVLNLDATGAAKPAGEPGLEVVMLPAPAGDGAVPQVLRLAQLAGSLPSVLDAQGGQRRGSALLRGAAALAAVAAAALVLQAWQATQQARQTREQLARARAEAAPAPRQPALTRDELARVHAVNGAIRQLNLPIAGLLRALQPPPDIEVAVLSVEVLGTRDASGTAEPGVKIVAEARDGQAMARYVGFVAERKPFTGAYLTRHDIVDGASERPYRFTVEAAWSD